MHTIIIETLVKSFIKQDMQEKIKELIGELHEEAGALSYGMQPVELYEPIGYIMSIGGKRMRPLLTILSYLLYREDYKSAVPAAMAVEIFHNFSLLHDDIMDDAPLRRGQPTVHEKWDANVAILSGDVMLVKAYEQLIAHSPEDRLKHILGAFNRCATEVCEGQQLDMNFEQMQEVTEADYIDMIRQKTAVLLGFSLQLGAILANAPSGDEQALYKVGVNMGIGFQLKDDLLDVYADQDKFGKQVGGDIIANKKTFLLINALKLATAEQKEKLEYWLASENHDKQQKVEAVKAIYDQLQIATLTESSMNSYFDKAFEALEGLNVSIERKALLKGLMEFLIAREQ